MLCTRLVGTTSFFTSFFLKYKQLLCCNIARSCNVHESCFCHCMKLTIFLPLPSAADNIIPQYCSKIGVELGSNVTLTCSRVCISETSSRWQLIKTAISVHPYTVGLDRNSHLLKEAFEDDFGVTLSLSDDTCNEGEIIEYKLTIHNANERIDQLNIQCGVAITNVPWNTTASSTTIFIGK